MSRLAGLTRSAAWVAAVAVLAVGCDDGSQTRYPIDPESGLRVPEHPPVPALPDWADNPATEGRAQLGRWLFNDARLSGSGNTVCATCHLPLTFFQSGTPLDVPDRSYPELSPVLHRNAPSLLNVVYAPMMRWDGSHFTDVYEAMALPFAEPNMNLVPDAERADVHRVDVPAAQVELQRRLVEEAPGYIAHFEAEFGLDITAAAPEEVWRAAGQAIAVYMRGVVSRDAPFDRWNAGEDGAMSAAAIRGLEVFRGKGRCGVCHAGPLFSDFAFHNVSTAPPDADGDRRDEGRFVVTGEAADRGAFLTPMLRSVARTSPYLHDGSVNGIAAVVRLKTAEADADPARSPILEGMPALTDGEVDDLVEFLEALDGAPVSPEVQAFPEVFP